MNSIPSFGLTSLLSNSPDSDSNSNRSKEVQKQNKRTTSVTHCDNAESTTSTTSESLKLNSDCLRITLSFLNIKDAHSLNLVSKNQNNEVNQILNQTHSQKILPKNICIPFGGCTFTLEGINMQIEAREGFPSTLRIVNDAGHWDTAFIIHCLDKNRSKEGYINNKRTLLSYAALIGDLPLLKSLKDQFGLTANDARGEHNHALRWAAFNGHTNVLRVLKNDFELTADDARSEYNYALRWAAQNGHVEVLRFLKNEFGLNADDARAQNNYALKMASNNGHENVIQFFKNAWGLTLA